VWNASNATLKHVAKTTSDAFAKALGAVEGLCPFSHPNASAHYADVCAFPMDWDSVAQQESPPTSLFGSGANFAFFVPERKAVAAMNWWRQHHGPMHYMMHTNTGCEYHDHSTWSMLSSNYPPFEQRLNGLWCCKQGPPSCSCDLVLYRATNATGYTSSCLRAPAASPPPPPTSQSDTQKAKPAARGDGSDASPAALPVVVAACSAGGNSFLWRETTYVGPPTVPEHAAFRQIEDFTSPAVGGGSDDGAGWCLGATDCAVGTAVTLGRCAHGDTSRSRVSWVGVAGAADPQGALGALRSDSCTGSCLAPRPDGSGVVELAPCDGGAARAWRRVFLD